MKKKLLCLALSLVMLLGILPMAVFATEETVASITEFGTTEADVYTIGTAAELNKFIELAGQAAFTGNVRLTDNIDFTAEGVTETPKKVTAEGAFTGVFDGNEKTITGLESPLFYSVHGSGDEAAPTVIKDVTVTGTHITAWDYGVYMSLFAVEVNTAAHINFENCHVTDSSFKPTDAASGNARVGGLIGTVWQPVTVLNVTGCSVTESEMTLNGGGKWALVGGLVGWDRGGDNAKTLTFENCITDVDVTVTNVADSNSRCRAAGLLGGAYSATADSVIFTDCVNYGDISISAHRASGLLCGSLKSVELTNCANYGVITGKVNAAGLLCDDSTTVTMKNCVNYGNLTADNAVIGLVYGGVKTQTYENCANFGTLTSPDCTGLIYGTATNKSQKMTLTDCLNAGELNATNNAYGVVRNTKQENTINITRCLNIGTMTGTKQYDLVGYLGYKSTYNFVDSFGVNDVEVAESGTTTVYVNCTYSGATQKATTADAAVALLKEVAQAGSSLKGYAGAEKLKSWDLGNTWVLTNEYPQLAAFFEPKTADQSTNAIVYEGVQYTAVDNKETAEDATDDTFNVRFVASISEETFETAQKIGYEIVMIEQGKAAAGLSKTDSTVYKTLVGYEDEEQMVYTAEDFGGDYLSAIAINNVTANGTVTMIVRPFVINAENETLKGTPVVSVFVDGVLSCQYAY